MRRIAAALVVGVALMFSAGSVWADLDDGAAAQAGDYTTGPLQIEEIRFFVQLFGPSGGEYEVSQDFDATVVPLVPDRVCYGWRIKVPLTSKLIRFREEFTIPTAPTTWSGESDEFATNTIIDERRTSVTNRFVTPDKGWVENVWCVLEGDPEGDYSMKVYFNDQFIKQFDFEVRRPPPNS